MNTKPDQDVLAEMENDLRKTVSGSQWAPREIELAKAAGAALGLKPNLGGARPKIGGAAKVVTAAQVGKALAQLFDETNRSSIAYSSLLARLDGGEVYENHPLARPADMPMFTDFADMIGHISAMNARVIALNTRFVAVLSGEEL